MKTIAGVAGVRLCGVVAALSVLGACAGPSKNRAIADPYPGVNTVAQDRAVWQQLLSDHTKIRRSVVYTPTGVEATTESDDPAVAARIIDHAKAMRARVEAEAMVRVWDPVFEELFAKHGAVRLEVSPTPRGVTIRESADNPEAAALLWSHAAGVCDFVREGHDAGSRATVRLRPGTPPPGEVAIGGVKHRLLMTQPDAGALAQHAERGAKGVVNFRRPGEHTDYDESAAAGACGMEYDNIGYAGAAELSDEVLDRARAAPRCAPTTPAARARWSTAAQGTAWGPRGRRTALWTRASRSTPRSRKPNSAASKTPPSRPRPGSTSSGGWRHRRSARDGDRSEKNSTKRVKKDSQILIRAQ